MLAIPPVLTQAPPPTNNPREEGKSAGFDESSWIWDRGVLFAHTSQVDFGGGHAAAAALSALVEDGVGSDVGDAVHCPSSPRNGPPLLRRSPRGRLL